jgi:hypothetical protein
MTSLRIFVKRGAIWRFHRLSRDAQKLPITVEWDRRTADRRSSDRGVHRQADAGMTADQDNRRKERRGEVPFTWDTAEFVVVDERDTSH